MAYEIDGMKYSYEYTELINELESDISEGLIEPHTIISILRMDNPICLNEENYYYPIIDYYYPGAYREECLEELYNKDEYSDSEWAELEEDYKKGYEQYLKDKPYLEGATVLAVLTEMKLWNEMV